MATQEATILKVEGMSCNHCKMSVEKALQAVAGVKEAAVNLPGKSVKVIHDPGVVSRDKLVATITGAGYTVI
ncbi:MAG TPA: copper resistance protein CopZ [Desulfotomaculum sp.]|jgi:copper chaperone|nr:copper resistance protein CopZ [Desulfotomaculum sp.]